MPIGRESFRGRSAYALRRGIGPRELGVRALQLEQLAQQRVVLAVGQLRIVEHVVTVVRLIDLQA